ncbi:MAG TPA: CocE/NonD family hydrolase [Jiangellaceae bacterium]|nr:CocE/NonD family hydrolase [Jiangellaceae bacterium]
MSRSPLRRLVALAVTVAIAVAVAPPAIAASAPEIVVEDGVTQPVFGYTDAIRERVWVETDVDSEGDGSLDLVALDIMRPAATEQGLKSPVVMDASPYFTTLCRGNESECIADVDGDGLNDRWPLFYDNYFVPRGYAVILLHMVGTGFSTGCPTTGGAPDVAGPVAAIDWLNGRRQAFDAAGNEVVADWHNGKTGMIGKSYDGTLPNGTAVTGIDGLATIVPISAISNWYWYTRLAGARLNGWHNNYPSALSNTVTNPDRRTYCAPLRTILNNTDGDESGDYTPFWAERDYMPLIDNIDVPVFIVHGLQDDNVKTNQFGELWYALQERDLPRKLWLTRAGHEEAFDFRRPEWVSTIHRWFDHWLFGIENGIMQEPRVDVETGPDVWEAHHRWPLLDTTPTHLWLRPGTDTDPGGFGLQRLPGKMIQSTFQDNTAQSEAAIISNLSSVAPFRLAYLSEPLAAPVRISGTPSVDLSAIVDQSDTDFGAALVDFGPPKTRVSRSSEGVVNANPPVETCWGESASVANGDAWTDDACYIETVKTLSTVDTWRVARGGVDGLNLFDYAAPTPLVPGETYDFSFNLYPTDYTFDAGHQIAVVIVSSYPQLLCSGTAPACNAPNTNRPFVTVNVNNSRVTLPIVGGQQAAQAAGF